MLCLKGSRGREHFDYHLDTTHISCYYKGVADTVSVAAAAQAVADSGRGLDVLVNNAGIEYVQPVLDVDIAAAQRLFDINLWGPWRTIQAFADLLIASRGRIVNVSSSASVINSPWVCKFIVWLFIYLRYCTLVNVSLVLPLLVLFPFSCSCAA